MLRKSATINIHLLRHAEAYKNLAGIHGGGNQRLTRHGEEQAHKLGHYLAEVCAEDKTVLSIVHQPEGRSKATAEKIGTIAAKTLVEVTELVGVQLGVVEGLSEQELAEEYPEVSAALSAWRTNKGDLSARPHVPGSEPMEEFADRVHQGLTSCIEACTTDTSVAIVGTTSTLNMINHLLTNDGEFIRSGYDFIEFPLGSLATWQISSSSPINTMPITDVGGTEQARKG